MSKKLSPEDWNQEYRAFLDSPKSHTPAELTTLIKKQVEREFNPSGSSVFFKIFLIHFVSGVSTLFVCPQFGIMLTKKSHSLLNLLPGLGEYGCMLFCGAFFLGVTGLISALLLKRQEVRAIRKSKGLQWALLTFLSVGFFLAFQEQEHSIPLGLAATWAVGGLLGGISIFRVSYELRSRLRRQFAF